MPVQKHIRNIAFLAGAVMLLTGCSKEIAKGPSFNPGNTNLVWIEPGTFTMGSPKRWRILFPNWKPHIWSERPVPGTGPTTKVTISKGFWMEAFEVTQKDSMEITEKSDPSSFTRQYKLSYFQNYPFPIPSFITNGTRFPVENISWNDATNYCGRLTAREQSLGNIPVDYSYRLPTEAEWEYACRAGTTTRYSYGDNPDDLRLYGWVNSTNRRMQTYAVGHKQSNPWGLYDLYGNVNEWCSDWDEGSLPGGESVDPAGPVSGTSRVIKGGSSFSYPLQCSTAGRSALAPNTVSPMTGFRIVLAPVRE